MLTDERIGADRAALQVEVVTLRALVAQATDEGGNGFVVVRRCTTCGRTYPDWAVSSFVTCFACRCPRSAVARLRGALQRIAYGRLSPENAARVAVEALNGEGKPT